MEEEREKKRRSVAPRKAGKKGEKEMEMKQQRENKARRNIEMEK